MASLWDRVRRAFPAAALSVAVANTPVAVSEAPVDQSLLEIASKHTEIAQKHRDDSGKLWGRLGGSPAENESAAVLMRDLAPYVDEAHLEPFLFEAWRPTTWTVELGNGGAIDTAMPAPFDAFFPVTGPSPIVHVVGEQDWDRVKDAWAFVEAATKGSAASTSVREAGLYRRAVESGAVGFIFSIPTPPGDWRAVVPVDKPFTERDRQYPDHVRPIPAFCVSTDDGVRILEAVDSGDTLSSSVTYAENRLLEGRNTVAALGGKKDRVILIACHLDSFFEGANDDASGIAVLVGIAREIFRLPMADRKASFIFAGLSGHHDEGAGMRALLDADLERADRIEGVILLEHLDAHPGALGDVEGWPENLNELRAAYVGPKGWPQVDEEFGEMVRGSGLMTLPPRIVADCIADLLVVCGQKLTFCLIQAPPFYHTNHDTIDKLTDEGLRNAVDFHLRFLLAADYIGRMP